VTLDRREQANAFDWLPTAVNIASTRLVSGLTRHSRHGLGLSARAAHFLYWHFASLLVVTPAG